MNGFLLDTNVVSELRKGARADAGLAAWFGARHRRELFLSAVTLAELRRGVALISHRDPAQSDLLRRWCDRNGVRSERGQALKRKSDYRSFLFYRLTPFPRPGTVWEFADTSKKSRFDLSGLPTGVKVWVQLRACNARGKSPWSDPATKRVP